MVAKIGHNQTLKIIVLFAVIFIINREAISRECTLENSFAKNFAHHLFPEEYIKASNQAIDYSKTEIIETSGIVCPKDITILTDLNSCGAYVRSGLSILDPHHVIKSLSWRMNGATIDKSSNTGLNQISNYVFNEGTTAITYRGEDRFGGSVFCSFKVIVIDNQVPQLINSPGNIMVVNNLGECGAQVTWNEPVVIDNCVSTEKILVSGDYKSGDVFPVGSTEVNYVISDGVNVTNHQFKVTVIDEEAPKVIASGNITVQCGEAVPDAFTSWTQFKRAGGEAYDNCAIDYNSFRYVDQKSSSIFCPYIVTRTYSIADVNGNTTEIKHVVEVEGEGIAFVADEKKEEPPVVLKSGAGTKSAFISLVSINDVTCFGGTDGSIDLDTSSTNGPITSILWSPGGQTSLDVTGLSAGTYSVTITDGDGSTVSPNYTINEPNILNASVTSNDITCNGANDGIITATSATGGGGTYQFRLNSGTWQSSGSFTNLASGSYSVWIRDAAEITCTRNIGSENITEPAILNASVSSTDITCNGANDGTITVSSASGGYGTYEYRLNSGTWQSSGSFTNLASGSYSVWIRDAAEITCTRNLGSENITEPAILNASVSSTDIICNGANDGTITVSSAGGGYGTYQYRINSGTWQNSGSFTTLSPDSYAVWIRDAANPTCTRNIISENITEPAILNASVSSTDITCNGASDGTITVSSASGGYGTYEYRLNSGTWQSSGNFTGLSSGGYSVQIRDAANPTCTRNIVSENITEPAILNASVSSTDITCNGASDGTITVSSGSGGYGTYEYRLNSGTWQSSGNFTGLSSGSYSVQIRDAANIGCTRNLVNETIIEPAILNAFVSSTNITCNGASDGTITVSSPTGGYGTYEVSINGSNWFGVSAISSYTFTNLSVSNYTVQIRDAANSGCIRTLSPENITEPPVLQGAAIIADPIVCFNGTGTVQITATGGTQPYTYNFEGKTSNSSGIFSGVSGTVAGTDYDWSITDANGCEYTGTITVTEPEELVASSEVLSEIECFAGTGAIRITASGGTTPLSYTLNGITNSDGDFTGITDGTWNWSVDDSKFCGPVPGSITIVEPTEISVAASVSTEISCYGGTGTVTLVGSGGTGPYEYTFNGQTNASGVFSGIYAGTDVSYSVIDANNCGPVFGSITITEPAEFTSSAVPSHVDCNGESTGSIDLTVVGGTSPYSFLWSNGSTDEDPVNLAAGTYTVTVNDDNGCATTLTETITEPTKVLAAASSTDITCSGGNSTVLITASGGTPGYEYSIDGGANYQASNSFSLPAGNYTVKVIDTKFCTSDDVPLTITEPTPVSITSISVVDNEVCEGESIQLNSSATGGTGTLTYSWLYPDGTNHTGQNPLIPNPTTALDGTYTLTVTDVNSCSTSNTVSVTVYPSPDAIASPTVDEFCSGSGTNISLTSSVSGTSFSWTVVESDVSGASAGSGFTIAQTLTATGTVPGTATYTITPNANNCNGLPIEVVVTVNPIPVATVAPDNVVFCHDAEVNIEFGSDVDGTTFTWSAVMNNVDNNGPDSGTGSSIQQTLEAQWPYDDPTITYTAIPTANNCDGASVTSDIEIALWIVNNGFTLSGQSDNSTVCPGDPVSYSLQSRSGRNYHMRFTYESDNPNIGLVAMSTDYFGTTSGRNVYGDVSFTAENNTDVPQTANIVFTAVSYWAGSFEKICEVESETRTITVDPFLMECPADYDETVDGGDCSAEVNVSDPNFTCPPPSEVTWDMNGATTAASSSSGVNYITPNPYTFNVGTTTIDYAAEDALGNTTSCTFDVTVTDDEDPTLTCPGNTTIYAETGKCGADFNYTVTADDNCAVTLTQTDGTGLISGSEFPVGTTTLTFYAEDAAGNSTTCSFDVEVIDTISPVLSNCVVDQTVCAPAGLSYVNTNNWDPTVNENCPGSVSLSYTLSGVTTGTGVSLNNVTFDVGVTAVEWIATDLNGNSSTCNFNVTVNEDPSVVIDQTDPSVCLNGAIALTSTATGTPSPTYQWRRKNTSGIWEDISDGGSYSGATTSDLTINPVLADDETEYAVVVSNSCTSATSASVVLSVSTAPVITQQPASQSDCRGESVLFRTAATGGSGTYTYYWERKRPVDASFNDASNDNRVTYPTDGEMLVDRVGRGASRNGTLYRVTITDDCGNSVTSMEATLTVNFVDSVAIVQDTICEGGGTSFTMTTTGSTPIEYRWRKYNEVNDNWPNISDGGAYSGATTATLTINNATPAESGLYSARAIFNITVPNNNSATTCTETDVRVFGEITVDEGPAIVASVETQTICSGSAINDIVLSNANGTPGTTYSWTRDNTGALSGIPASGSGATISGILSSLTPETPVTTTFTITATANGCASTSTVSVTVMDDEVPTIASCQGDIVIDTDPANCNATVSYTVPTFNDNCDGLDLVGTLVEGFKSDTIFPFGTTSVKYVYEDGAGNVSDTCFFNVTINDNAAPNMVCKDTTVHLDVSGLASITANDVDGGTTDGCGLSSLNIDITSFDCTDIGPNTVTLSATDLYGNSDNCAATVTITDTLKPQALCKDINVYLDVSGNASINSADIDNGSSDACGILSLALSASSFDCTNVGSNTVDLTVTDNNDNVQSCSSTVTVLDTIRPTSASCPVDETVTTDPLNCSSEYNYTIPTFDDNCDGTGLAGTLVEGPAPGAVFPFGTTTVKYVYQDAAGNVSDTCSFDVSIVDNQDPVALCKDITVQLDASGLASIVASDIDNGSSDGCGLDSLRIDISSFDCATVGANTITLTVVDLYGNDATCQSTVTVADTVKPQALCRDTTVYVDVSGNVSISALDIDDGSSDACGIASLVASQTNFDCSNLGTNTVNLSVTDNNTNLQTCSSILTILDTILPTVATCPGEIVVNTDGGLCSAVVTYTEPTFDDNCDGAGQTGTLIAGLVSGATFPFDTTQVVYQYSDGTGNGPVTCSFNVIVVDNEDPTALCQNITVQLDALGLASISAADVDGGSSDACGIDSLSIDVSTFDCTDLGDNLVTLTATDLSGNTNVCVATVTIADDTNPVNITAGVSQTTILCYSQTATITIASAGGVGALSYEFNGVVQAGNTFAGISAGTYTWSVSDPFNCGDTSGTFEVIEPEILSATIAATDVSCSSGSDGVIAITNSAGGDGAYEYTKDGGATWQTDSTFTNLAPGLYNVQMRDGNNCSEILDANLEIIILSADLTSSDVTCYGGNDGSITVSNPAGGTGTYQFTINGGSSWESFVSGTYVYSGLVADTFDVRIRDAGDLSCIIPLDTALVITQPDSLHAIVDSSNITCFGVANGTISITLPAGGTGTYEYTIDGGTNWSASGIYMNLTPGTYNVRIRDALVTSCEKILNVTLELSEPAILAGIVDSTNISCNGYNDGDIVILSSSGGSGTYEYTIDGGASWQTDSSFQSLYAGTYDVRIRDVADNSCEIVLDATLVLTDPPAMVIATQPSNKSDCYGATIQMGVVPNGGAGTITYEWQRQKPSEASFTSIPTVEINVLNQYTDTLTLLNLGNADSPDGTQYRVVISDLCSSIISDTVTVRVSQITDVTPADVTTEICEGENYSLQVATSGLVPTAYQWQINAAGTWVDLADGIIISGSTSNQLNITGASLNETGQYRVVVTFPATGGSCNLDSEAFERNLIVHPVPTVDHTDSIIVCNGDVVPDIIFTGTATSFNWVNDNTAVGMVASGSGNISSYTAVNTDTVPIIAHIEVTPLNIYCEGIKDTFTIVINPTPTVVTPIGVIFCDGVLTDPYVLSGTPSGVVFTIEGGTSIGLSDTTGVTTIPSFLPIEGTATLTVTPEIYNCEGASIQFDVTVMASPIATIAGGDTVCQGETATNLIFSNPLSAVVEATYTINGANTSTVVIPAYTPVQVPVPTNVPGVFDYDLVSVRYITDPYCANTNIVGTAQIVVVEPPTPTIIGPNAICEGTVGNVYTTEAGMTNYIWNVSAGGTITAGASSNSVVITWNTAGNQNVSVRYSDNNACTAATPTIYPVTVNSIPVPTIVGSGEVCMNSSSEVYTTQAGMNNYVWVISAGGNITSGGGANDNSVTVDWISDGSQTISVNYTNASGCVADSATLSATIHNITVNPEPEPSLSGNVVACSGSEDNVYTTDAGMTNYVWTVSSGGNIISGGTFNDNTATVRWNTAGAQSIGINYIDTSGCTALNDSVLDVTVNPSPTPTITGSSLICAGSTNASYSTEPGMSNYDWTISAGGTITSGANDSIVYVTWNSVGNHTISVDYTNSYNCNAITPTVLNVTAVDEVIPTITGVATICEGSSGNYSTQSGMSDYNWTVVGGTITAGGDSISNTTTIVWDSAGAQSVGVYYLSTNGCISVETVHSVTVNAVSVPTIIGESDACIDEIYTYSTEAGMSDYQWILSPGGTIVGGVSDVDSVIVQWNTLGAQSVSVNYTSANGCRSSSATVQTVTVNDITPVICPNDTTVCVTGGIFVLSGASPTGGTYSGTGVTGANFNPGTAGVGVHILLIHILMQMPAKVHAHST